MYARAIRRLTGKCFVCLCHRAERRRWLETMETLTCLAHTPALRRTGVGSSPAMWNFLDNAKLHVEDPSLAGDDFDLEKIESEEDFAQAVAAAEAAAAEASAETAETADDDTNASSGTGSIGTRGRSSRRGAWVTAAAAAAFESWTSQSSQSPNFNVYASHSACTEQSTRELSVSSRVESLVAPRHAPNYLCMRATIHIPSLHACDAY